MDDVISRVQVDYTSTGADQMLANYERVARAEASLARQAAASASATDVLSRSTLNAGRALDAYTRSHDPLSRAMADMARGERLAAAARAQGIETTEAHTRAMENARKRVDELREQIDGSTRSHKLNTAQTAELTHVAKSLFDEIAAGASPFRALSLEAGRIGQVLSSGQGGVGGTMKAMLGTVTSLMTPTVLLTGAVAGLGVAGTAAFLAYESGQAKIGTSIDGLGRQAGATIDRLNAIAAAGAKVGGLSTSEGLSLAGTYTRAGITPDVSQSLIGSTKGYARFSGSDVDDAGKRLAAAVADPVKGAGDVLAGEFGALNGQLRTSIDNMMAQGRVDEARRTLTLALNAEIAKTTDMTWGFSKALEDGRNWLSNTAHDVGKGISSALFGESPQDEIKRLQGTLARTSDSWFGRPDVIKAEIERLQTIVDAQARTDRQAVQAKRDTDANALSLKADDVVRAVLPDLVKAQGTANNLAVLQQALADPNVLSRMGVTQSQAQRAFGNLSVQASYDDPLRAMAQDGKLATDAIEAFTLAERAAVDARRAELAVLRESGDVRKAALAAEIARNQVIAKANSEASDRADQARQDAALVGLSPYARGRQEIINRYEGVGGLFSKDAASTGELRDAMKPVATDLEGAAQSIADAMHRSATVIAAAANPYGTLGGFTGFGALSRAPASVFPMISDAADRTGIPASVIAAIGERENGFRLTGGTSLLGSNGRPSSAYGFGQLTNGAARDVAAAVPGFDKYNPATAVFGSAEYLSILSRRNGGDMTAALNAYGGTPGYAADIMRRAGGGITIGSAGVAPIGATALRSDRTAMNAQLAAYDQEQSTGPLKAANQALDAQVALLDRQRATLGQTASQIQGAAAAQKLLNDYTAQGLSITPKLRSEIEAYGDRTARLAQDTASFEAQQQRLIGSMDLVRTTSRDALGTFVDDLVRGRGAGQAFADVLGQVSQKALGMAENSLIDGLFGKSGTTENGLLGGSGLTSVFSSLFGSLGHNATGTDDWKGGDTWVGERGPEIIRLPAHSQVVPNGMATYPGGSTRSDAQAARDAAKANVTVNFTVKSPDVQGFQASQAQIGRKLASAVGRGQRNT